MPPWIWTPPKSDRPAAFEEIPVDGDARDHVVQADAGGAALRAAANVAPAVPPDHDAAIERVAEHVDPALVVGLLDHVADHVQLDEVVVALDPHGGGRHSLEEVVGDPVAAAVEVNGGRVGAFEPGDVGDRAVLDEVPAGSQRLAVAAGHARPAAAERVHRAAEDAVALPALDDDGVAAEPPERAAGDQAVRPAADVNPVAAALLERQSEDHHVLDVVHRHERPVRRRSGSSRPSTASTPSGGSQ